MPNGVTNVLNECFCLVEDPFDPKVDPHKKFSFSDRKASLSRSLDIFNIAELEYYFIKIGMFKDAVDQVANFLLGSGFNVASNNPPTFLIEAPTGAGRSSLASYIAYQVKKHSGGKSALQTVPVGTEDEAKLAFSIKKLLEMHVKHENLSDCETVFVTYPDTLILGPNGPDMSFLSTIFQQLSTCMVGAPPLLLIIEEITYERMGWLSNLYKMLAPLNVILIFLTNDVRVRKQYEKLRSNGDLTGCRVRLGKLDEQAAVDFFVQRLDSFRREKCDETKRNVFPFDPKVFTQAFKDEEKHGGEGEQEKAASRAIGVKLLLNLFRQAFNLKLLELNQYFIESAGKHPKPELKLEELLITWDYFNNAYQNVIRAAAIKKDY